MAATRKKNISVNNVVSIVLPFAKAYDELERCLSCVPAAMGDIKFDMIIIDNGNEIDDLHTEFFGSLEYDWLKVIRSNKNIGYPGGINLAVKRSFAPLLFILTSDVYLEPGSGVSLVNSMKDKFIGVCGMKLIFPLESTDPSRPPGKLQHIGLHTDFRGEFVHTFMGWSPNHPRVNKIKDVYAITGAAFMTRRNLWNKIGGFDEVYGKGYYEDVDYCLSVRELGYNVIVDQNAVAYHAVGASFAKPGMPNNFQHNRMIFMEKWADKLEYWEYKVL